MQERNQDIQSYWPIVKIVQDVEYALGTEPVY